MIVRQLPREVPPAVLVLTPFRLYQIDRTSYQADAFHAIILQGIGDIVTETDKSSEEACVRTIQAAFAE